MFQTYALLLIALITVPPEIDVVYPRLMDADTVARIDKVDENFIFGSVQPPGSKLWINNQQVPLHPNGSFIAFIPVDWNLREYFITAVSDVDTTHFVLPFDLRAPASRPIAPGVSFPVQLELSSGVARTDPAGAYYIFPLSGTVATAESWTDGYYEIPLHNSQSVWIAEYYVKRILDTQPAKIPVVWKASVHPQGLWEEIILPIGQKKLFRVSDNVDPWQLTIDVFGVISHIDRIAFRSGVTMIREVTWEQINNDVLRLNIFLNKKLWGYRTTWDNKKLKISIRKPPEFRRGIKGLRIAIDPGHGGDMDGSIGPSRLKEKDINLQVARALNDLLLQKGAETVLIRDSDYRIGLNERINVAVHNEADLLISIHHNALPDGTNPFGDFGTGTHFYHPQSRDLAETIQESICKRLGLFNEGVYYNNLALVRPTALPAVLVESAYIMLPEQEEMMRQEEYPRRLAKAIYLGVKQYIKQRRKL